MQLQLPQLFRKFLMANRPLSPHLQVYRLPLLPLVSILTRACALALSLGVLVFAVWLIALGFGGLAYDRVMGIFTSSLGQVALIGWTFAFMWHSANGVRHLFWDMGRGLDLTVAERGAYAVITFAVLGTLAVWAYVWTVR